MFFQWNYRIQETCTRYVLNHYLGRYAAKGRQKMLVKATPIYRQFSRCSTLSTFKGEKDRFNGLTVDLSKENCDVSTFSKKLEDSLEKWKGEGRRCIWFSVNISDASIVPVLAKKGFNFHHARDGSVMMHKWLPTDSGPNLPPPCHTNLGVGAMVFNQKNQILAVSERHYEYPHWKLPGGYVERGEEIIAAGKREVREETGVECEFQSLVTFRHTHNMMYGNSDIYVLLMMNATSEDINISHREVKDAQWMHIEEYTSHPHVHEWNRTVVSRALDLKSRRLKLDLTKKTVKWAQNIRVMSFLMLEDCQS